MSISGVWAASITPLTLSLDIDRAQFARHIEWLLERGCDGVAVFGSTGEANSFSVAERTAAVDSLAEAGIEMHRIVVGAGACAFPDAVEICRNAVDRGCAGVLVTPPFYYKGVSDDGIFAFFERLMAGVGSDALRVVLYHFPRLVAVGYSEDLIARLVERWPVQIAALKDSSGDLDRMIRIVEEHPSLAVLAGDESLLLDILDAGGAGCLTASANVTSRLCAEVLADRDPDAQDELSDFRDALSEAPFVPGLKQLLSEETGRAEWLTIRPPLEALSFDDADEFREIVSDMETLPNFD
ncbi:MAG: 4-hydroxy-tetrahydrodipicolinate synthase [Rhodothermales bacterium]|jgi:4-hydroxy-tetrahydrodipicolinate synthase